VDLAVLDILAYNLIRTVITQAAARHDIPLRLADRAARRDQTQDGERPYQ
jgi:hypothetical protein